MAPFMLLFETTTVKTSGHPEPSGIPGPDCGTPQKIRSQGHILLNSGDGIQEMGWEQGSFLLVWVFFYSPGINFDIAVKW